MPLGLASSMRLPDPLKLGSGAVATAHPAAEAGEPGSMVTTYWLGSANSVLVVVTEPPLANAACSIAGPFQPGLGTRRSSPTPRRRVPSAAGGRLWPSRTAGRPRLTRGGMGDGANSAANSSSSPSAGGPQAAGRPLHLRPPAHPPRRRSGAWNWLRGAPSADYCRTGFGSAAHASGGGDQRAQGWARCGSHRSVCVPYASPKPMKR